MWGVRKNEHDTLVNQKGGKDACNMILKLISVKALNFVGAHARKKRDIHSFPILLYAKGREKQGSVIASSNTEQYTE